MVSESLDLDHVRYDDGHKEVLKGVSVDEDLSNHRALGVNVLELFWGDVLSLRKFEDILCAIDDFDGAVREDHADISGAYPAVLCQSLLCPGRVLKVAFEDIGTLELNLTARRLISGKVSKLRAISESDSHGWDDTSNMTALRIFRVS